MFKLIISNFIIFIFCVQGSEYNEYPKYHDDIIYIDVYENPSNYNMHENQPPNNNGRNYYEDDDIYEHTDSQRPVNNYNKYSPSSSYNHPNQDLNYNLNSNYNTSSKNYSTNQDMNYNPNTYYNSSPSYNKNPYPNSNYSPSSNPNPYPYRKYQDYSDIDNYKHYSSTPVDHVNYHRINYNEYSSYPSYESLKDDDYVSFVSDQSRNDPKNLFICMFGMKNCYDPNSDIKDVGIFNRGGLLYDDYLENTYIYDTNNGYGSHIDIHENPSQKLDYKIGGCWECDRCRNIKLPMCLNACKACRNNIILSTWPKISSSKKDYYYGVCPSCNQCPYCNSCRRCQRIYGPYGYKKYKKHPYFAISHDTATDGSDDYSYRDQGSWQPEVCQVGKRQSPIDLSYPQSRNTYIKLVNFNRPMYNAILVNTGKTVKYDLRDGYYFAALYTDVANQRTGRYYKVDSVHFHWPSEHTIRGKRFELESHIVTHKTKYATLNDALNSNEGDAVMVIGTLYSKHKSHIPWCCKNYKTMMTVASQVTAVQEEPGKEDVAESLTIRNLLPKNSYFFAYEGSLTSPPCSEKVQWIVFKDVVKIKNSHLKAFLEVKGDDGNTYENARNLQNLYGRIQDKPHQLEKFQFKTWEI